MDKTTLDFSLTLVLMISMTRGGNRPVVSAVPG